MILNVKTSSNSLGAGLFRNLCGSRSTLISSSEIRDWLTASVVLCCLSSGCSLMRMGEWTSKGTPQDHSLQRPIQSVAVPGSPEIPAPKALKNPARVHVAYGRWLESQRLPQEAQLAYQRALEHEPQSLDALLGLARLELLAQRHESARAYIEKAQQAHPQDPLVMAAWGEYYASIGDWSRAIDSYQRAISLAPQEPIYRHQLGVIQTKAGAIQDALATFTAAIGPAEAHYNVGVLLYQQGNHAAAELHLQQALRLNPQLTPASKMLAKITQAPRRTNVSPAAHTIPQSTSTSTISPPTYLSVPEPPQRVSAPILHQPQLTAGK